MVITVFITNGGGAEQLGYLSLFSASGFLSILHTAPVRSYTIDKPSYRGS